MKWNDGIIKGNIMDVDGRKQILLKELNNLYCIKKGRGFLYFCEIDEKGVNKRKHFVTTLEKDEWFFGQDEYIDGKRYALILSGQLDTEVIQFSLEDIHGVEEEGIRKEIMNQIGHFYSAVEIPLDKVESIDEFDKDKLDRNNKALLYVLYEKIKEELQKEKNILGKRSQNDQKINHRNLYGIVELFQKRKEKKRLLQLDTDDPLYNACKIVCNNEKIPIIQYSELKKCINGKLEIGDIARVSKFAIREVMLEKDWWLSDSGCLIVYTIDDERPMACIPRSPGHYTVYDVKYKRTTILDEKLASEVIPKGYMIYRPFPQKRLDYKDIFLFGIASTWKRDLINILIFSLIGTLIGLILPTLNQKIFDDYVPEGESLQLIQIGMLVIAFIAGNFLVSIIKFFATFRATNSMEYGIQSAVYDRLVNFPMKFYEQFSSGELASRAMGITTIFNTMADVAATTILTAVFSVMYLWRMVSYSGELSLIGLGMVAVTVVITLIVGFIQLKYEKRLLDISNKISGLMYQLLLGISKIRVSGAENRAVYQWNKEFLNSRKIVLTKEKMVNIVTVFNMFLNTIFSVVLYSMLIVKQIDISFGQFMGFTSAFGSFSGAMVQMAQTFLKVNRLVPIYDRAKPILETTPEYEENLELPGELMGEIELSNINFRYSEDTPYVLKDISLNIKPGEYVGIVGPSGSGKSTLLKIMLGFEKPETGKVFYDDKDIEKLDKRELRKKLGVVLQGGQLISGSIFENITITNNKLTMPRVREVIKESGLEKDIDNMPMGIHTVLGEGASTISGGQRQRLLIARAIANKPRILFFDEATSALDNITQSIVCQSLDKLNATRVVIAHRLSTIVNCDRIVVIDNGRIVEQGSYEELMNNKGVFYELASRQIA